MKYPHWVENALDKGTGGKRGQGAEAAKGTPLQGTSNAGLLQTSQESLHCESFHTKKVKVEQLMMLAAPGALKPPCRCWEQPTKLAANPVSPSSSQRTGHPCRGLLLLTGISGARVQALQQGDAHGNLLLAPASQSLGNLPFIAVAGGLLSSHLVHGAYSQAQPQRRTPLCTRAVAWVTFPWRNVPIPDALAAAGRWQRSGRG